MKNSAAKTVHLVLLVVCFSQAVSFATAQGTWDGGGGDDNWGTGQNWVSNAAPSPGLNNDLQFQGSTRLTPFNNYTAFDDWRNILFNSGAGSFNISGNAIDLFGKIENNSTNSQTVGLSSIALNSATSNEFNPVNGNLTINSSNIFTNGNQLRIFGNNGFTLTFGAGTNIQQGGSIAINQNSTVVFNSAHSYTGDTFVNAGRLWFNSGASAVSSTLRLGDTLGSNSVEFGLTNSTGGQAVGNTIFSRAGSSGSRTIDSKNTSGSNSLTGGITLDASLTIRQAAGGTLNLSTGTLDMRAQTLTVDAAGTVVASRVMGSSLSAGGSLIKSGSGTLVLANTANNYTGMDPNSLNAGGTQIAGGTLAIAADTSLGLAPAGAYNNLQFTGSGTLRSDANISLHANRNISVASGSTASFDSNGNTLTINGVINGTGGNIAKSGSGTVILNGTNTYTGTTTIQAGTLQVGNGLTTGSLGTGNVINNSSLAFNRSNAYTVANQISGSGSVSQNGTGTTSLTSANTYTGNTTVSAGSLIVSSTGSINSSANTTSSLNTLGGQLEIASGGSVTLGSAGEALFSGSSIGTINGTLTAGTVSVTGTSTLQGTGTVAGNTTINSGATLASGNSIGSLTVNGSLSLASSAIYSWEVDRGTTAADLVDVNGILTLSGATLNLIESGTFTIGSKFTLFAYNNATALTSGFAGWANNSAVGNWMINYGDTTAGLNGGSGNFYITISAIPEPNALLLVGLIAAAGTVRRRRGR